jgi:hypothetical protein
LALASLRAGKPAFALERADESLELARVAGTDGQAAWVDFTAATVLEAAGLHDRACALIDRRASVIREAARRIRRPEWRASFLAVMENARVLVLADEGFAAAPNTNARFTTNDPHAEHRRGTRDNRR